MSTATEHLYVTTDKRILGGEPVIRGTRTPVRAIVELWRQGIGPEEICRHLPHLTLAQIFDALSYYSDHKEEINTCIELNSGSTSEDGLREKPTILIIDADQSTRILLEGWLRPNAECTTVGSAEDAQPVLKATTFNLVIADIDVGESSPDLARQVLEASPDTVVVMIGGQQTIDYAIQAMRNGAFDYITKPLEPRLFKTAVRRALSHHELLRQKRRYENHLEDLVKERSAEIEHLAYYDGLTGLPNRALFVNRCAQALMIAQRNQTLVVMMLLSIDRFKEITETLGHAAGDAVLNEAAARLQNCVANGDTVARFEGAEFALLLTHVAETGDLAGVARIITETFNAPFQLGGQEVYVNTSMGISLFPIDGEDSGTILRNAVAALSRAQKEGGNNFQFYTSDMNSISLKRLGLETRLRRAIENEEFVTYYQPVVNLTSGENVGFEALVRWQHPELGLLPPANFLGLAEDTGLILNIGEFVMRSVCSQASEWQKRGLGRPQMSINVSARDFQQKDFLERMRQILDKTGTDPTTLQLELTETSIMENVDSALNLLGQIRKLGIKVAIDNFGTGYSSLSYLKRLPIDALKLDRSFVNGATTDPNDAALVMAIITLAHNLNLKVIAVGVETEEQVAFLRLLRCDEVQGFLFGKPGPAHLVEASIGSDPDWKPHMASNKQDYFSLPSDPDKRRA